MAWLLNKITMETKSNVSFVITRREYLMFSLWQMLRRAFLIIMLLLFDYLMNAFSVSANLHIIVIDRFLVFSVFIKWTSTDFFAIKNATNRIFDFK